MNTALVLIIVVVLLEFKWLLIFFGMPFAYSYSLWAKNRSSIVLSSLALPYRFLLRLTKGGWDRFIIAQIAIFPSVSLRKQIYKILGSRIGKNVVFHWKTEIRNPINLVIGDGCIIGDNAILDARQGLTFGKNVNLSSNVSIYTMQHDYRDPYFACNEIDKKMSVEIDDRAWLGSNVIELPGVHIGEGAVCCAGSVVTKDVSPYEVVAGIPAKKIAERPNDLRYEFDGGSCWFY